MHRNETFFNLDDHPVLYLMNKEINIESPDFWITQMRSGNFEDAWNFSDAVLRSHAGKPCWHWPRHAQYIWDGTPLDGKRIFIRCYRGLGDTIQYIRYAPLIKAIAKEVIVWAQPSLIRVLETVQGIDRLLPVHDGTPDVTYDVDMEIMELPHIFRTTLDSIPSLIPYIHVEPLFLPSGKEKPSVGLVWKAGDRNPSRSVPFQLLFPLSELHEIEFYILQDNPEEVGWDGKFGIHLNGSNPYEDARIIRSLDLLISVDTMPAHLAGAMGVPVWTLLPSEADWRWMENRDDSPWYPTMRLFRQQQQGEWQPVINDVMKELRKTFNLNELP
jgi:hypothetical protein